MPFPAVPQPVTDQIEEHDPDSENTFDVMCTDKKKCPRDHGKQHSYGAGKRGGQAEQPGDVLPADEGIDGERNKSNKSQLALAPPGPSIKDP